MVSECISEGDMDRRFAALADPKRRAVVAMLCRGPLRAGALADALDTSPAHLSRHLKVLRESGLVVEEVDDEDRRARQYRVEIERVRELRSWVEELEAFWCDQLQAFKAYAEQTRPAADHRAKTTTRARATGKARATKAKKR